MLDHLRSLVSENRCRFVDEHTNLDLSYVTDRIIAMSYPSSGLEGLYRNSFKDVKRFLDTRHKNHYKVYNLRSEKQYRHELFEGATVVLFGFGDHQAPPFELLVQFCKDAKTWLDKDTSNTVVIHCKAGKGRTGTMIAALLLYIGYATNADEAIQIYGTKRTTDGKGITIPSQIRYVHYFERWMKNEDTTFMSTIHITQLAICNIPQAWSHANLSMTIEIDQVEIFETDNTEVTSDNTILMPLPAVPVKGDFKMTLFTKGRIYSKQKYLCHFWLNTRFVSASSATITLAKDEIDGAFNDTHSRQFPKDFAIQIQFSSNTDLE
ncbi:phosphatase and tensin homolog [Lichtheimia corymbifera JMRC:FSU:9682]|uniref:Phosphatidylinositol 3,4,5-trisphosphate 3-phosphatase and dual-specificity protein phosphatase PTEN n=1 Tax=Lichtheimia corymbifera JMRC:FSU:9682 TaxID=1263082 RepID=A0A068RWA8_9FUNG|nr:phosphatase and tensin homolog [Lichtheimia corymbifera JMRC:FSU:9682]